MKIHKKKCVIGVLLVFIGAGLVFSITKPKHVPVIQVEPKNTKLTFSEEGFVKDETSVEIYSLHTGAVVSVFAQENQLVSSGDPICVMDSSQLFYDLVAAQNDITGLQSQINNLDIQEKQRKEELLATISKLEADYSTLEVEEKSANQAYLSAQVTKEEQVRLQNMILAQNKTDLQVAKEHYEKNQQLYDSGIISKSELEKIEAGVQQMENHQNQNKAQLEIIKNTTETQSRQDYYASQKNALVAQIKRMDHQLQINDSEAMKTYYATQIKSSKASIALLEKKIEQCTIKAPTTGIITKLNVTKSNVINTTTPVAVITTGCENLIEVYVPTSEIDYVHLGDEVDLSLKSAEETTYTGIVTEIDDHAVIHTSSLGTEKRKVKVTIKPFEQHAQYFKPGYDLNVTFTKYNGINKLTVPRTSVFRIEDKIVVWVANDGKIEQKEIEIEKELKVEYVIKKGIEAGESVVKDGAIPWLQVGTRVVGDF